MMGIILVDLYKYMNYTVDVTIGTGTGCTTYLQILVRNTLRSVSQDVKVLQMN